MTINLDIPHDPAERIAQTDLPTAAAAALRASVKLSSGIVGVMDLLAGRNGLRLSLSDINRTATIRAMRQDAEAVLRFVDALEAGAK